MNYILLRDIINLVEKFEMENKNYTADISGFKHWIYDEIRVQENVIDEPDWEGKENGRSPESVINTLIVHMNRYAKTYSKSAMHNSEFSTQEEFIYLINLQAFGSMTKMELIKKNIQDKPTGMQIINRLIAQGWIVQKKSETDKRSKIINITASGIKVLEKQMDKIRQATSIVTGNLNHLEKMELIRLLDKLDHFHKPIFLRNIENPELLDSVTREYLSDKM
ncbi:MarR family winged helix-turn-helix transcriptional regulator [Sphingobacterium chuzhouense]|uniref:MarR family transcriptional regulator n=1 Tax=Sphingobacterium chuzhouense TaxID=1742264 RepID=A0ABR7XSB5_9SPHI|nr:helix-turn-helix domain-containing protein [Sphingobacterium chuzhouense]MBD1422065.1 MarR family transcriptional regulator [Sphingobacterium chuzhouense]